jgi:hypothetical protein
MRRPPKARSRCRETAGGALFGEVEKTTDLSARTPRERLAILLKSGPGQGNG